MTHHAPEHLLATAVADFFGAANHGLTGLEQLVALNLQATRTALVDASGHVHAVFDARSTEDLIAISAWPRPLIEQTNAWSQAVAHIAIDTATLLARATELSLADVLNRVTTVAAPTAEPQPVLTAPASAGLAVAAVETSDMNANVSAADVAAESPRAEAPAR
jgi:hypothetical protein